MATRQAVAPAPAVTSPRSFTSSDARRAREDRARDTSRAHGSSASGAAGLAIIVARHVGCSRRGAGWRMEGRAGRAVVGLIAAVIAGGCGVRHAARQDVATTDLMSAGDRTRLAAVAAERRRSSGSYRIGADDLLDVRIPDLLSVDAATQTQPKPSPSAGLPAGIRVSANGEVTIRSSAP
jgi:hypothetical protein